MGNFRQTSNVVDSVWTSSDLIDTLTGRVRLFIFAYSPKHKALLSWSKNAQEVLGVKDIAIARDGNLFLRHVHPDDRFLLMTDLEQALKGGQDYRATYRWIRPDNNELRWLHCRGALVEQDADPVFEGIIMDLSSEFTGQVGKIAGPDSISTIMAAFPTMVFTVDKDLRILRLNRPESMHSFNFGDPGFATDSFKIGRSLMACFSDLNQKSYYEKTMAELLEGRREYLRTRIVVDESVFSLEICPLAERGSIEGLMFIINEVSEIVSLERQLAQLQKSEGLRLLAAGVAHNFNNSLQSIIGQAAIIKNHPDKINLVQEASQAIIDTVARTSEMARQLFIFEDPVRDRDILTPVDVNLAAMAAVNKVEGLFSSGLKISVAFGTPSPVLAQQEKIVQAIEAILKNARESMENGGSLSIKTYQVFINQNEVQGLKPGSYAKVSISDSGSGMTQTIRERCLEPFFTTKEHDPTTGVSLKGSGLGLSQANGIAREMSGIITLESQVGFGTTVSLYLPIQDSGKASSEHSALFAVNSSRPPDILIVDDDLLVLQTAKQILEDANFSCAVAEDSTRALSLANRFKKELQIVLIDAVMPGMDGASLLKRLKKINPNIKAIGFSGAPNEVIRPLREAGATQILRKPVDSDTLRKTVRQMFHSLKAA